MARRKRIRGHGGGSIIRLKDGRFRVAITVGIDEEGKQRKRYAYARTLAEAETRLSKLQVQHGEGVLPEAGRLLLGDYLDRWLEYKEIRIKPSTYRGYKNMVVHHIKPALGRVTLAKLTPLHLETLYRNMLKKEVGPKDNKRSMAPRMCQLAHAVLHQALEQAIRWSLIARNPAAQVEPPKGVKTPPKAWTSEEALKFLESIRSHRFYAMFYLALVTGMRRGELLGLKWSDIDFERGYLNVERSLGMVGSKFVISTPKTEGSSRLLKLSGEALEMLQEHKERQDKEKAALGGLWHEEGWVFPSEIGNPMRPYNFDETRKILMRKAGVPLIRFHDLRHTHVSLERRRGTPLEVVSKRLGHSNPGFTLKVYRQIYGDELEDVLTLNELMESTSKNPKASNDRGLETPPQTVGTLG